MKQACIIGPIAILTLFALSCATEAPVSNEE
jgi:hypothetical protein